MPIYIGTMRRYTTPEVAELAGVHLRTLHRWLEKGAIPEPQRGGIRGLTLRLWSGDDVKRVKRHKEKFYRKGRGRKKVRSKT